MSAPSEKRASIRVLSDEQSLALQALVQERRYQQKRWSEDVIAGTHRHSSTEFLVYIRDYVEEALHRESRAETSSESITAMQHSLRKIGALALAAMEQNGVCFRSLEEMRKVGAK